MRLLILGQKLRDTKAQAAHLEQGLQNIYQTAISGTSELAAINQADAERNQHVAAAVREVLSDFVVQIGLMVRSCPLWYMNTDKFAIRQLMSTRSISKPRR